MTRKTAIEQQVIARVKSSALRAKVWSPVGKQGGLLFGSLVMNEVRGQIWNQVQDRVYGPIIYQAIEDTDGANSSFRD